MSGDKLRELGWHPRVDLHQGIANSYQWFLNNKT
jgi:nucleoside-diphosphate-sugar epimerase